MKHTPQSKVDKKKRLCVSPVIKSVTIISDTQILSYRFNLCVVTYQYKVSLFLLEFTCNLMLFGEKSNSLICPQIVFFSLNVYLLTLLYILKKVCWEIEKEYPMCVVNLLCLYINLHIIEKAPQREGRKNVTASRW